MLLRLFERRLAESSWLSFNPALPAAPASKGGWTMDVLGNPVDPSTVVFNGSRHFHAVHRGVEPYNAADAAASPLRRHPGAAAALRRAADLGDGPHQLVLLASGVPARPHTE